MTLQVELRSIRLHGAREPVAGISPRRRSTHLMTGVSSWGRSVCTIGQHGYLCYCGNYLFSTSRFTDAVTSEEACWNCRVRVVAYSCQPIKSPKTVQSCPPGGFAERRLWGGSRSTFSACLYRWEIRPDRSVLQDD
jgi:hypothetical protein